LAEVQNGNGADTQPKGKARLLSLEDLDRRTGAYRKTAELIDRVEADLGGADRVDRRAAAALTGAMLEDLGARWLSGEAIDPALYVQLSNSERRLYETVGLRRVPRDVTPDPLDYARRFSGEDDAA
jgi:hypothetical protein